MPKLYTVKALAALFEKDEETIRCWIRDGDVFPGAFKVRDGWYVPAGDIKKMITQNGSPSGPSESSPSRSQRQPPGFVTGWK